VAFTGPIINGSMAGPDSNLSRDLSGGWKNLSGSRDLGPGGVDLNIADQDIGIATRCPATSSCPFVWNPESGISPEPSLFGGLCIS